MFSNTPSIGGKRMAQLYINDLIFTQIYPMEAKSDAGDSLQAFIHEIGTPMMPNNLHMANLRSFAVIMPFLLPLQNHIAPDRTGPLVEYESSNGMLVKK
jgi:hypothetical protein